MAIIMFYFKLQNWYEARDACAARGGRIATLHSDEDRRIVGDLSPVRKYKSISINIYVAQI
jgi:hypothetical protein